MTQPTEPSTALAVHAPERPGPDGLGYGRCASCGEVWPCETTRRSIASRAIPGSVIVPIAEYEQLAAVAEAARAYANEYRWLFEADRDNGVDSIRARLCAAVYALDDEAAPSRSTPPALIEAARALVASEAAREDVTVGDIDWIAANRAAMAALTAAVNALDAPETDALIAEIQTRNPGISPAELAQRLGITDAG